ncbi:MAG: hypothetical protein LBI61_01440 [Puniceicoccales bacterium]|jgi:hypothetical protein|nr:hypothetical protein [Puniceicoccales bacterium]
MDANTLITSTLKLQTTDAKKTANPNESVKVAKPKVEANAKTESRIEDSTAVSVREAKNKGILGLLEKAKDFAGGLLEKANALFNICVETIRKVSPALADKMVEVKDKIVEFCKAHPVVAAAIAVAVAAVIIAALAVLCIKTPLGALIIPTVIAAVVALLQDAKAEIEKAVGEEFDEISEAHPEAAPFLPTANALTHQAIECATAGATDMIINAAGKLGASATSE